jgi:tetratricopeptide (TPR) repeat protein
VPFEIDKVNGEWLWVGKAWIHKTNVVALDDAVAYYTSYLRQNRNAAWAYYLRGKAKEETDHNGVDDYTAAIRLNPNIARFYIDRASALEFSIDRSDRRRALDDYTQAIRIDANNADAYMSRSLLHEDPRAAIADYTAVIRLDPDPLVYEFRAKKWKELKDYDRAIADYTSAIQLESKNKFLYLDRGLVHEDAGRLGKAIADFTEATWLDDRFASAYSDRGRVWAQLGDYDKAIADLNEAIRLDSERYYYFVHRGKVWAAKGEYDRAIADFAHALRITPPGRRHEEDRAELNELYRWVSEEKASVAKEKKDK